MKEIFMKDLKCSLKDCRYNQGFSCVAESITVDDCAQCTSYEPSPQKSVNKLFEIADIAKPDYEIDTQIACKTDSCVFNRGCCCNANGITVLGNTTTGKQCADCATFTPKD